MSTIYENALQRIEDGAKFKIDFKSRTLRVNSRCLIDNGVYDRELGIGQAADEQEFFDEVEKRYARYKHSLPSERSTGKQRLYFMALPESELQDEDMWFGTGRDAAQFELEMYILCQLLQGFVWNERTMGKWFWQSRNDRDLVILREWMEK